VVGLKTLTIQDIPQAWKLSNGEGWNQTEKDWKFLVENPGNICLAVEEDGEIVGTATAMNYENKVAWIGMVLVAKNHRGKGFSKLLLSELLNQLKSVQIIKLDATPAGQPVYQKFGFKNESVINRMILDSVDVELPVLKNRNLSEIVHTADIPEIVKYDAEVFGVGRNHLIEYLVRESPDHAGVLKRHGQIKGILTGRKGARFFQVGPVSSESAEDAKMLILQVVRILPNQSVLVDVLDDKKELTNWLLNLGFKKQRQYIRMYLGENQYQGTPENQFLICGPEFG
jgi:GNAT superfamily N-acetyltransferase